MKFEFLITAYFVEISVFAALGFGSIGWNPLLGLLLGALCSFARYRYGPPYDANHLR